jgi:hypothetical protein
MRKLLPVLILALIALCLPSCRRTSHNGRIDGFWRIDEIAYAESGETVSPTDLFIAVNLELLQLDNPQVEHTGIISYHKGDPRIGVEFPYNPSAEALYKYGFPANPCVLDIVTLDSHRLVLSSPVAVISCTRY